MASANNVPANKGISVKTEDDDPEITAMALKMKENFQKNALAAAEQQAAFPANVFINRAGIAVTLTNAPITTNNNRKNQDKVPKDSEDVESYKGRFSWELINEFYVPSIIRVINGEQIKFVAVRMAETEVLIKYLHHLHEDTLTCTAIKSFFTTGAESKLLNCINQKHVDYKYGNGGFFAGKDIIVRLEDVSEFYTFIEVCYNKLQYNITPGRVEKCGFIRINSSECVVPFTIKDNIKYLPLFYFEGEGLEILNLSQRVLKLENWNLAYLKFCCKYQGIKNELFASDSYAAISLDDIKNHFPPETNFEDYWPVMLDTHLLIDQKSDIMYRNPSGAWTRPPLEVVPAIITIATAPEPLPPSLPVMMNTYQSKRPANQMVNSYSTQVQPPSTHGYSIAARNQSIAAQYCNAGSTISQGSSLVKSAGHVVPPPPFVCGGNTTPVIGNTVSYSNVVPISQCITTISQGSSLVNTTGHDVPPLLLVCGGNTTPVIGNTVLYSNAVPISQCITTMHNPITSGNVMSHSSQMRQLYTQCSNNSQAQQQQLRKQQQQQQKQQIITTPQTQQPYSGKSVRGRLTNTQQRNASRNARHVEIVLLKPSLETIDLTSPPSSPVRPAVQENILRPAWELTRIPERTRGDDTSNNAAYKIQNTTFQGRKLHCINAKPYIYSELMVTLHDLVQMVLPSYTVARCAYILNKYLKTTLFSGNSEQLCVLLANGRVRSMKPNETPMAMLKDVAHALPQLKALMFKSDEQIQQYQAAAAAAAAAPAVAAAAPAPAAAAAAAAPAPAAAAAAAPAPALVWPTATTSNRPPPPPYM